MNSLELAAKLSESLQKGMAEIAVAGGDQFVILNFGSKYVIQKDVLYVYHAKGVRIGRITQVNAV